MGPRKHLLKGYAFSGIRRKMERQPDRPGGLGFDYHAPGEIGVDKLAGHPRAVRSVRKTGADPSHGSRPTAAASTDRDRPVRSHGDPSAPRLVCDVAGE